MFEDSHNYTKKGIAEMLDMVHEGNKSSGGLIKLATAVGIFGFIRFLDCYYLTLITSKKRVGNIGSHIIYTIRSTEVIPIKPKDSADGYIFKSFWNKINKKLNQTPLDMAESRYLGLYQFIDCSKDFYFSYTYDVTHTLQYNYITKSNKLFPVPAYNVSSINYDSICIYFIMNFIIIIIILIFN